MKKIYNWVFHERTEITFSYYFFLLKSGKYFFDINIRRKNYVYLFKKETFLIIIRLSFILKPFFLNIGVLGLLNLITSVKLNAFKIIHKIFFDNYV